MKSTGTCPKCAGRELFHIPSVAQTYCDAQGSLKAFAVTAAQVPTGKKGLLGGDGVTMAGAGPYEAYVCAKCGHAEWYASPGALVTLAQMAAHGSDVHVVVDGVRETRTPREG